MDAQLTIFDALNDERDRQDDGLRRIDAAPESGTVLLGQLYVKGWRTYRVRTFGGAKHPYLFILTNGAHEVMREGECIADVATELFEEASKLASAAA